MRVGKNGGTSLAVKKSPTNMILNNYIVLKQRQSRRKLKLGGLWNIHFMLL